MYLVKKITFVLIALSLASANVAALNIEVQQVLQDGINSVDGLDNPRQVKSDLSGKRLFVTSGDDNSLLILQSEETIKPLQLFKSSDNKALLEGASSLITFNKGKNIAVVSFYDSALSVFEKGNDDNFKFIQAHSDNVSYERIFKSGESLISEDRYGLFGAWDIAISSDEKQIYVASYKSDAISIFDVNSDNKLAFNHKYVQTKGNALGGPTSIALSDSRNELIVSGYENNTLTILSVSKKGKLSLKQTIKNGSNGIKYLVNPQKAILSPNEKYLYVACSGSNALLVFESKDNQYSFLQAVAQPEIGGTGLKGVGSIALSDDGTRLFAAGEMDKGLLLFNVIENGNLQFDKVFQSLNNKIEGVTSIAVINEGKNLLLTLGKMDALYLLKVSNTET